MVAMSTALGGVALAGRGIVRGVLASRDEHMWGTELSILALLPAIAGCGGLVLYDATEFGVFWHDGISCLRLGNRVLDRVSVGCWL